MHIAILDKYIARQVVAIILLVTVVLVGLDLFFTSVQELKNVGRGHYTLSSMLQFLGLTLPGRIYAMFPWSALLGSLMGLGVLATHHELVVMRTASVSVMRLCYSVIKGTLWLILMMVLLGEVLAPLTERLAQNKRTLAISGGQSIETPYGLWVRQGQDFIHVRMLNADGQLSGVTRYQFDNNRQLKAVSFAETAVQEKKGWRLQAIQSTHFLGQKTQVLQIKEQVIENLLEPEILESAVMKHPERLSLLALSRIIQHRAQNELHTSAYELAFWRKVFQPFLIILMVVLAVPFVFGPLRSSSMGFRGFIGILMAYLFHTLNGVVVPVAVVYQVPPILAVLSPLVVFAAIGYWLLKRVV